MEASSKTTRERLWNWFTDDWGSRFAANAGMVVVMRWHVDDVLGIERTIVVEICRFLLGHVGGYTEPYWDQDGRYRVRWCPERMVTRCWRSSFLGWCRGLTPHENRDITT
jgi:hypothetical protein